MTWTKKQRNDYWRARGKGYKDECEILPEVNRIWAIQEEALLKLLTTFPWKSLLEVGCGYGRQLKRIGEGFPKRKLFGFDISTGQLANAEMLVPEGNFRQGDIFDGLPHADRSIDVILTSEFMMHIHPEAVDKVYQDMTRAGKRVIMMEYQNPAKYDVPHAPHNWNHNYKKLISASLWQRKIPGTNNTIIRSWK